jgi:hypothetical protein
MINTAADAVRLGDQAVSAVYLGTTKIFPTRPVVHASIEGFQPSGYGSGTTRFSPVNTISVSSIQLWGTSGGSALVGIVDDPGYTGHLANPVYLRSKTISPMATGQWNEGVLATPITLQAGVPYALVVQGDHGITYSYSLDRLTSLGFAFAQYGVYNNYRSVFRLIGVP